MSSLFYKKDITNNSLS